MRLSEEERASRRAAFRAMRAPQKAEYVLAYYKLPLVIALIVLTAAVSLAHRALTEKDRVLYVAFANVAVGRELDDTLTTDFLTSRGYDPARTEVYCYRDLYLAEEASEATHQYAYASKLKTMATTDAEQLDVVLMNREAYDLLSRSGYLLDLDEGLSAAGGTLPKGARALLVRNEVVIEDNQVEVDLGEADAYEATTETHANALDVSTLPAFSSAHLSDTVYLGIIANTPRLDEARAYVAYLLGT